MKNLFYNTSKGKGRGYWLFDVLASNRKKALQTARTEAKFSGDVVTHIKRYNRPRSMFGLEANRNQWAVFGGRR